MTYFSDEQISILLGPIHPRRVSSLRGLSYVEGYDIRAELTRVFGFGRWSEETLDQQLICENETTTSKGGKAWYVVYRTRIRLTVKAPDGTEVCSYDGAHIGSSTHPERGEAHGNALTNSQTYALRRCAINLGDQFGLGLYNKGSLEPIVRWTLVRPENVPADTEDVPQVSPETPEFTPEEASEPQAAVAETKPARQRKTATRSVTTEHRTPDKPLEDRIREATTVEKLREYFKEAGTTGVLKNTVILDEGFPGQETITIENWLFRRSDELGAAKSNSAPEGNADAGSGMAGE